MHIAKRLPLETISSLFAGISLLPNCERISEHTSHSFDLDKEAVMAKW
jgi:hypothetical protein